jgi:hypothetical protein
MADADLLCGTIARAKGAIAAQDRTADRHFPCFDRSGFPSTGSGTGTNSTTTSKIPTLAVERTLLRHASMQFGIGLDFLTRPKNPSTENGIPNSSPNSATTSCCGAAARFRDSTADSTSTSPGNDGSTAPKTNSPSAAPLKTSAPPSATNTPSASTCVQRRCHRRTPQRHKRRPLHPHRRLQQQLPPRLQMVFSVLVCEDWGGFLMEEESTDVKSRENSFFTTGAVPACDKPSPNTFAGTSVQTIRSLPPPRPSQKMQFLLRE